MLTQMGVIVALEPAANGVPMHADIDVMPPSACERCAAGQGCGAGLFSRLLRIKATRLRLPLPGHGPDDPVRIGQPVWLGMDERQLARQAWYWYGLPVIAFVLGAGLSGWLWPVGGSAAGEDGAALLGGLLAMLGCWLLARATLRPAAPRVLLNSPCAD